MERQVYRAPDSGNPCLYSPQGSPNIIEHPMLSDSAIAPRSLAFDTAVRTLLLTDLVGSTRLVGQLGDTRASEVAAYHDRAFRDLLPRFNGLEIDKSDGFLLLFERPLDAVGYALAYHRALVDLSTELGVELEARVGIHLGEVLLRRNSPDDVARGAKRLEVEGIAKPIAARLMALARGNQTLLTRGAFDLARRSTAGSTLPARDLIWLAHGAYRFKGVEEPMEVFEAGVVGVAPLAIPPDYEKARRVVSEADEITLGWRPAPDQEIPLRPNWTLAGRLGEGGFGEVWLGRHKKTGEQRVFKFCYEASKLRSLQREATLFRLLKETLGQRDDIARILDWNFDQAPYFLESEYTEGGNLIEWAEQQGGPDQVPLATRLELIAQVADALTAAHSVGVLHKDVKPSNVLITTDRSGAPTVRLTDFGIGGVMDEGVFAEQGITVLGLTEVLPATGQTSKTGTQLYMAPELLEGKPSTVQADIYALGVLLYQIVAGDFSHALAPGWRRDVPDEILAGDIAQMVDGSPRRRPSSAREAAGRLRRLEQRRVEAETAKARERAHRRWRLFAPFGAVAIAVLLVVSTLAVQAMQARRVAELRRNQAEDLITFMLGDLREKVEAVGRIEILHDVGDKALEYFASVPEDELTADELFQRSAALAQIGRIRLNVGNPKAAAEAFKEALELSQELVARDPTNVDWQEFLADRQFWVGRVLWDQGDLEGALERFRVQLKIARDLCEDDPLDLELQLKVAHANTNIGFVQKARGDLQGALDAYRSTLEIKRRLAEREPEDNARQLSLANHHNLVGWVLMKLGDLPSALEHFYADQSIARAQLADDPANTVWQEQLGQSHNFVGLALRAKGEADAARRHFQAHLKIAKNLVAIEPSHMSWQRHLAIAHLWVGDDLKARRQPREALDHARQALEIFRNLVAVDSTKPGWQRDLARGHLGVGEVLAALEDFSGARESAEAAITRLEPLVEKMPGDRQSNRWLTKGYLLKGHALAALGQATAANNVWQRAADTIEPLARESRDLDLIEPWSQALLYLERRDEAEIALKKIERLRYGDVRLNGES